MALVGCGAAGDPSAPDANEGPPLNPLGRARCHAPTGVSGSPENIQQAVELLNALPKPTPVACFLESLDRPLAIDATSSIISLQPALSVASPRVFVKMPQLWLSVVIAGDGSRLLEFGDVLASDPPRSIKGELDLPLEAAVAPSAPYERVLYPGGGTQCGFCHAGEQAAPEVSFTTAFSSVSLRPRPDTHVTVDYLRAQSESCDWQKEPQRCEMLSAVFDGGDVVEGPFPATMPTFF